MATLQNLQDAQRKAQRRPRWAQRVTTLLAAVRCSDLFGLTGPIACTVAGYRDYGNDVGSLMLRNNRTGKLHQAWPYSCHRGVWGVVPA